MAATHTMPDNSPDETLSAPRSLGLRGCLTLWLLFFLICFGLGYPTLNRYDPRLTGPDQVTYYRMVTGQASPDEFIARWGMSRSRSWVALYTC